MIGVVLWSDPCEGKAVFWCEDQGDLAYYEAAPERPATDGFFDSGDMVQFEVAMESRIRKAHNARLLQEQAWVDLPESLRRESGPQSSSAGATQTAKIIPFKLQPEPRQSLSLSARKA